MGDTTAISWVATDGQKGSTWNPIGGTKAHWTCQKISPGCEPCYASTRNEQLFGIPFAPIGAKQLLDEPRLKEHLLKRPYAWTKQGPRRIFPGSMTDLWGEWVPFDWQRQIYKVAMDNPDHTYIWLTKRPAIMSISIVLAQSEGVVPNPLPPNWWMGTTVEEPRYLWRTNHLREINCAVRWISLEPLYMSGPFPVWDERLYDGIHWHVVGGVSGPTKYARDRYLVERTVGEDGHTSWIPKPQRAEWIADMRDAARKRGVAWFFKQFGGPKPESGGHMLMWREEYEFPKVEVLAKA